MRFILLLLFSFIASSTCFAAEWTIYADIFQDLSYNDNVRLSEDAQGSVVYQITPELKASHKTQNSEITATASYGYQLYTDIPELDSENKNYTLSGNYLTENTIYSITSGYKIAPARNSAESDNGDFSTDAEKTMRSVAPAISYNLTGRDTISLSGIYSDVTYSSDEFSDSENKSLNLAWQQQWTERYSGSMSIFYSQYESSRSTQETSSDTYGVDISSHYLFSEKWEMTGNIGFRYTESLNKRNSPTPPGSITEKTQSKGFLSASRIHYYGEKLTASLLFNRSLTPSGTGQLNEQTKLSLNLGYKLTERLSASLISSYQTSESASSDESTTRTNITIQPGVSWKLTPDLVLRGSYRYRLQDISNRNNSVDSNTILLTLNYNWQGLRIAR